MLRWRTHFPASITQAGRVGARLFALLLALPILHSTAAAADEPPPDERFRQAWAAARDGDRPTFEHLMGGLLDYRLHPYLRYEDLRARRDRVPILEMAGFLTAFEGWAFHGPLRRAWLRSLGERGEWEALLRYASRDDTTRIRCDRAHAQIRLGETRDLLGEAQSLWTVGRSQPDECDPVFEWLRRHDGITPGLAWERIRLAMVEGNPRLTLYLKRYVPAAEQVWVERWQQLNRDRYRGLASTRTWTDNDITRMITSESLGQVARRDPAAAWDAFERLDGHFRWSEADRAAVLHAIALHSAVDLLEETPERMRAVPEAYRDAQLLQWWTRWALAAGAWDEALAAIEAMPAEARDDGRWRYWRARALEATGDAAAARSAYEALSAEATYHGFLAADRLARPYAICPLPPAIEPGAVEGLRGREDFARALELRRVGLDDWARAEWSLATGRLDAPALRAAAALALEEGWPDRAIFALGDSGDTRYYEWRFPLILEPEVVGAAQARGLDPSWVYGIMRSESAMAAGARSGADARGLMQVTPATARRLSRAHGLAYPGAESLYRPETNIEFGTVFLRELLERFDDDPVAVMGAYNAGPGAAARWLAERPRDDVEVFVETIPYFETRDYIPRVLAFTTIYDWRRGEPVRRVSQRMRPADSGKMVGSETAEVACLNPAEVAP